MKIRHRALLFLAALLASCGTDSTQSPNADPPVLSAQLDGRYAQSIRIEGDQFTATGPGQEIVLTFAAQGMVNVKQFELRLEIEPVNALAFEGSSFIATDPFLTPPFSIELTEEGLWRTGGASITETKRGDDILGTLTLRTGDGFTAGMQVQVRVAFFSLGPSFSDRDSYTAADLNMGVVINGG
ncbi:MAG: hypothetical protein F4X17_02490 [Gemmatimonadetes bacterium]|nr:hypothetical protein [Gemmatimonadota bacterium]MYI60785.1 hypothetical protein [Gemmatimonadota bacterium]